MKRRKIKMTAAERKAGINEVVRDWLLRTNPEEESMIGNFSKKITFKELARRMRKGDEFYEILDCTESVQREYCFGRLAELYDTNYEYWYQTWLHREPPKSKHVRPPRCNGKFKVITRIVRIKK
jgi:hypothetical protein